MIKIRHVSKVHEYNVFRTDGRIVIQVQELIRGENAGKYLAMPFNRMTVAQQEFWGIGCSPEEALEKCLQRIENIGINSIFQDVFPAELYNQKLETAL